MRKIILPSLCLCILSSLGAADPAVDKAVLEKHAREIAAVLPPGWSVRVDKEGTGIQVERDKSVLVVNMLGEGGPGAPPLREFPYVYLRVMPPCSAAQVAQMQKTIAMRDKALDMMRAQMADMIANVKPDRATEGFAARTPEQQARLDAFVAVKDALPGASIPDLFARDASFSILSDALFSPTQEADLAEVLSVRHKVESVFASMPLN